MASAEIERLQADYPEWRFYSSWIQGNSGPGVRMILATRKSDGLLVGGLTAHEITDKIIREDEA